MLGLKLLLRNSRKTRLIKDTIISVQYYRIITGACQQGCESWIKANNIKKDKYKASELLPILEKTNAYGLGKFKSLLQF